MNVKVGEVRLPEYEITCKLVVFDGEREYSYYAPKLDDFAGGMVDASGRRRLGDDEAACAPSAEKLSVSGWDENGDVVHHLNLNGFKPIRK